MPKYLVNGYVNRCDHVVVETDEPMSKEDLENLTQGFLDSGIDEMEAGGVEMEELLESTEIKPIVKRISIDGTPEYNDQTTYYQCELI